MKRIAFFLFFGFCFVLNSNAQYQLSLKGGAVRSNFFDRATSPYYEGNYQAGWGFYTSINYKERKLGLVNWNIELSYHQKKSDLDVYYGGEDFWISKQVSYGLGLVSVALLPEFSFGKSKRFYFYFGPSLGWIVHSSAEGSGKGLSTLGNKYEWTEEGSAYADFNGPDCGLKVGLGIEYPITDKIKIMLDPQFSMGFINLANGEMKDYGSFISTMDQSVSVGVAYFFQKKEQ